MPRCRALITAGPTHEPIDEVRYLANRSSGRMGVALADAAAVHGWNVTLLLGPTHLRPSHPAIAVQRFTTTAELGAKLEQLWPEFDLLIMAAAVADYRPRQSDESKMSRGGIPITVELEPTEDLLAALAQRSRPDQRLVGFALEPVDRLLEAARTKLQKKRLHAIVANPLEAMDAERATVHLILQDGTTMEGPRDAPKTELATWIVNALDTHVLAAR